MRVAIGLFTLTSLFFAAVPARAQTAVDPSGHWEGTIQAPEMETTIEVDLARDAAGVLMGTFAQPGERLTGLLLSDFALEGRSIRFQIKGKKGERAFDGQLSDDGKTIIGTFTMQGFPMPFRLTRTGDARIEAPAASPRLGDELVGSWDGTLDVKGTQLRLTLTMANRPDGTSVASILNIDQGLEIPVSAITQTGTSLTLALKSINGSYTGAVNSAGTELVGAFSQGPGSVPLTFRRAK
jgi:hypothetical protein